MQDEFRMKRSGIRNWRFPIFASSFLSSVGDVLNLMIIFRINDILDIPA
jgi:hypothetical protein